MFGLTKSKTKKHIDALVTDTAYALDSFMSSAESTDELLDRLGLSREQVYAAVNSDDEVESCKEDLRTAMMASGWRLYGDGTDDAQLDRIYRVVRKNLSAFVELVLTARLNGYAVGRYIYRQDDDGLIVLDHIADRRDELDRYKPKRGGELVYRGDSGEEVIDTQVMHLLLVNRATAKNPAGEMAVARLYPAVSVRKNGFLYAHQFIKRYAQPYMVGKVSGDAQGFIGKLFAFVSGGAITVDTEDSVEMLTNSANGEGFEKLERMANARIQKALLGRVKISDLANGSRAAQETEENTRQDRIEAYLSLLSLAIQHAVDAMVAVNAVWGVEIKQKSGLWFEFNEEIKVDKTRAERDKMYADTGMVRFTEEYFVQVLGFEKEHFELLDPATQSQGLSQAMSAKLSNVQNGQEPPLLKADQALMQPKIQAVLNALQLSESYADFESALSKMDLSEGDMAIIDKLVGESVRSFSDGLLDGK
ncbi:phage portal protein family protein [Neisseria sp. S1]|uniref:phage portal protein family protein n=1 Tax=Neisseria sp. S1 TaxID=3318354 RepID=UPI003A8AF955